MNTNNQNGKKRKTKAHFHFHFKNSLHKLESRKNPQNLILNKGNIKVMHELQHGPLENSI